MHDIIPHDKNKPRGHDLQHLLWVLIFDVANDHLQSFPCLSVFLMKLVLPAVSMVTTPAADL